MVNIEISKVKIIVIKKFSPIDIFGHEVYSTSGTKITTCGAFDEGQEFIVEHIEKMPEGFCGWAWRDIYKDLSVLYFNGNFYGQKKVFNIHHVRMVVNLFALN